MERRWKNDGKVTDKRCKRDGKANQADQAKGDGADKRIQRRRRGNRKTMVAVMRTGGGHSGETSEEIGDFPLELKSLRPLGRREARRRSRPSTHGERGRAPWN